NDYREENGLMPVSVSPTLNRAADVHAHDMATHGFMSHTGSDGSMPWDRAWAAGYPRAAAVSENIASGMSSGSDALLAWRSSTQGHNENMINPAWQAIGISREQGSGDWYWSTSYGDVLDCPTLTPPPHALSLGAGKQWKPAAKPAREPTAGRSSQGGVEAVQLQPLRAAAAAPATESPAKEIVGTKTAGTQPGLFHPPTPAFTLSNADP